MKENLFFYLMCRLPKITWYRFGIWMLAGLLIYFATSVHHSKIQHALARKD
jgi:hypothetical protein